MNQEDQKKLTPIGALKLLEWACQQQKEKPEGCAGCELWLEEPERGDWYGEKYCWLEMKLEVPPDTAHQVCLDDIAENEEELKKVHAQKEWKVTRTCTETAVVWARTKTEARKIAADGYQVWIGSNRKSTPWELVATPKNLPEEE